MNPKVKQLAEQAGGMVLADSEIQKFAELIVRECVIISRTSADGFSAGRKMEEYFGVVE